MKRFKYLVLGLIATFALASSSKAAIGVTTNFSKFTISMMVATNAPATVKNNTSTYKAVTLKFSNKDLLALSASWAGSPWPAGAQLEVGWDEPWNGQLLVVDKTGTNVLFDTYTWGGYPEQYFYLDLFDDYGAYTETENDNIPGSESWVETNQGYFELYDNVNKTDITGSGMCTQNFDEKWVKSNSSPGWTYSTWSDSEKFSAAGASSDEEINGISSATMNADITVKGSGHGENPYLD